MATYTPSLTPRLRMTRHSPINYDRSQIASTSESGPSRLPEFSQLVDMDLNDMATSDTTEQPTQSRISSSSTATRSDNPAAVLRALLSRLPTQSSPPRSQSPQQYPSERESDYEGAEPGNTTTSRAQESLRNIFSKARRDPDTPQKSLLRRNSVDVSDAEAHSEVQDDRAINKGKQRSLSDDEFEQSSRTPHANRAGTRSKLSPQPITKEFLRERFSTSYASSAMASSHATSHQFDDPSNESLLLELNSSGNMPPVATSTPQQSLRISVNSQFHSNLLESDTEMQHAIDGLDSFGENFGDRSMSPPPTIKKGPKPKALNYNTSPYQQSQDLDRTPMQSNTRSHNDSLVKPDTNVLPEVDDKPDRNSNRSRSTREWYDTNDHLDPHAHQTRSLSSMDLTAPLGGAVINDRRGGAPISAEDDYRDDVTEDELPERPNSRFGTSYRHNSGIPVQSNRRPGPHSKLHYRPNSPYAYSVASYDELPVEQEQESEKNFDSPHPWYQSTPNQDPNLTSRTSTRGRPDDGLKSHRENSASPAATADPKEFSRSQSSLTRRQPCPIPNHTSSLQMIDNTYLNRDPNPHRPSRSSSPLQPSSKKRPASPITSTASRKQKATSSTPLGRSHRSTHEETSNGSMGTSSGLISGSPLNTPAEDSILKFSSTPRNEQSNAQMGLTGRTSREQGFETDELRDTDFSSRGGSPIPRPISPVHSEQHVDESGSSSLNLSQFPVPPSTPRNTAQAQTPPRRASPELSTTPSTPPQRSASRNSRRDFKISSPPQALPDLPTPSSSDESENLPTRNQNIIPKHDPYARQDSTWSQTPRPPGGWSQTPKPSRKLESERELSDEGSQEKGMSKNAGRHGSQHPRTPLNRSDHPHGHNLDTIGKTPRPPGGWLATPTPISATVSLETPMPTGESRPQNGGLLTPMTSLSKGATFDPKTPGVPGGWVATPAVRKSILKVRFDPRNQTNQPSGNNVDSTTEFNDDTPSQAKVIPPSRGGGVPLPPFPRSPRKGRGPNIRVVDAFGRQQDSSQVDDDKTSRSLLCVVDALGREVQQTETSPTEDPTVEHAIKYSSRGELLTHIRRGLDNLAVEFEDEVIDDTGASVEDARIAELNEVSRNARLARERLQDNGTQSTPQVGLALKSSWRNRRRFWLTMLLLQFFLLVFMFRISSHWAKQHYLNSYYDPFNPELYLYWSDSGHSYHLMDDELSRTSWSAYARRHLFSDGRTWHDWLRFTRDIRSYLWNILHIEPPPRNSSTWLPT